jgi:hypothetical protein
MREHQATSRYAAEMQEIMSDHVAPRVRWDDSESRFREEEIDETKLREIWKELAGQLLSRSAPAERENSQAETAGFATPRRRDDNIYYSELREDSERDHYLIWQSNTPRHDYAVGASLAFNPFAVFYESYTCKSDLAAIAADWDEVRGDMVGAWTALIRDDPVVKRVVEKSLGEERAIHDESAT